MKLKKLILTIFVIMLAFPGSIAAKATTSESTIENLIPEKMVSKVTNNEKGQIEDAVVYGIFEAVSLLNADPESPWISDFKEGKFKLKKVVPVYNLNEQLSEVMVIFNKGYVIVDPLDGELIQFSYGVNESYFDDKTALYNINFDHFALDSEGSVVDGNLKGKKIDEIKEKYKNKTVKKKEQTTEINKKWGSFSENEKKSIIKNFDPAGANEGTSIYNYITDPKLWLLRWYPNTWNNISDLTVTELYSYSRYVPEILQADWGPKGNDCAPVATLEILGYYWSLTSTQKRTAYDTMVNSSYFVQPDGGVYPWNNDQLFKIAAESINKPIQQTSDDPEDWSPSYADMKSYLKNNGPGYLSMNQEPYYDHTLTAKGVKEFKTTFKDEFYIQRTYYDNFIKVNDHWSVTSGDTYVKYRNTSDWYYVSIVKN